MLIIIILYEIIIICYTHGIGRGNLSEYFNTRINRAIAPKN